MKRSTFAGSHPEEHYVAATRKRMFLDRPTSHGGWPEGEYDPPVADRIYGWYKKMGMMPEDDMKESIRGMSGEQKRDAIKHRAGRGLGYLHDPKSEALADEIAGKLLSGEMQVADLSRHPNLIRNVLSAVRAEGAYALAKEIEQLQRMTEGDRAAGYVDQRGNQMRITESMLRRIIREEYSRMNEADDEAVKACKDFRAKKFKSEDEMQSAKKSLAASLSAAGAKGEDAIGSALEKAGYTEPESMASELAKMQSMKEGQRGNDENGQHDNDTDPSDPHARHLKEARRLAVRKAVLAEMRKSKMR